MHRVWRANDLPRQQHEHQFSTHVHCPYRGEYDRTTRDGQVQRRVFGGRLDGTSSTPSLARIAVAAAAAADTSA